MYDEAGSFPCALEVSGQVLNDSREGRGYQLIIDPFVIIGAQRSPGPRADSIETFHAAGPSGTPVFRIGGYVERCLIWR